MRTDFIEVLDAIDGVRKPKDGSGAGAGASGAGREQNVYRQIFDRLKVRSAHRRVDNWLQTQPCDYSVTIVQNDKARSWSSIRDIVSVFLQDNVDKQRLTLYFSHPSLPIRPLIAQALERGVLLAGRYLHEVSAAARESSLLLVPLSADVDRQRCVCANRKSDRDTDRDREKQRKE